MQAVQSRTNPIGRSVTDLTTSCITKFERLLVSGAGPESLENALADFRLWAHDVGALEPVGASLDSTLVDRPDDLGVVKGVLSMLCDILTDLIEIRSDDNGKNYAYNPAEDDVLWSINSSLESLDLISIAIRRTGKASRIRRTDNHIRTTDKTFNPSDYRDFRRQLERIVILRTSEGVDTANQVDTSMLDGVQNRLVEANLRRRHCFLTAQKHYLSQKHLEKREVNALNHPEDTGEVATPQIPALLEGRQMQSKSHLSLLKGKQKDNPAAPHEVSLGSIPSTSGEDLRYNPVYDNVQETAISHITALSANTESRGSFRSSSGHQVFACPCCCRHIPVTANLR